MRKLFLVCLITLSWEQAVIATIYSLTDLGTLGGNSSYGTAISPDGKIATGYSLTESGNTNAFRWTLEDGIQNISPGALNARGFDVNDDNNIVGRADNKPYRWTSGSGLVLIDGANNGTANGLNSSSEAIGTRNLGATNLTIQWNSANTPTAKFIPSSTRGIAINDNNELVGNDSGGGYFSDGATRTPLSLDPTDINIDRLIGGSVSGIAALLDFDTNETTLLGKLSPTDTSSSVLGINKFGTVVGTSVGTGGFIFDSSLGSLQNLSSMLAFEHTGWTILSAEDISDGGRIIGVGEFAGVQHAVVLSVIVPELDGDFDSDGDCDGRDFLAWQRGESPNPFSSGDLSDWQTAYNGGALSAVSVPEPTSLLFICLGTFGLLCRRL